MTQYQGRGSEKANFNRHSLRQETNKRTEMALQPGRATAILVTWGCMVSAVVTAGLDSDRPEQKAARYFEKENLERVTEKWAKNARGLELQGAEHEKEAREQLIQEKYPEAAGLLSEKFILEKSRWQPYTSTTISVDKWPQQNAAGSYLRHKPSHENVLDHIFGPGGRKAFLEVPHIIVRLLKRKKTLECGNGSSIIKTLSADSLYNKIKKETGLPIYLQKHLSGGSVELSPKFRGEKAWLEADLYNTRKGYVKMYLSVETRNEAVTPSEISLKYKAVCCWYNKKEYLIGSIPMRTDHFLKFIVEEIEAYDGNYGTNGKLFGEYKIEHYPRSGEAHTRETWKVVSRKFLEDLSGRPEWLYRWQMATSKQAHTTNSKTSYLEGRVSVDTEGRQVPERRIAILSRSSKDLCMVREMRLDRDIKLGIRNGMKMGSSSDTILASNDIFVRELMPRTAGAREIPSISELFNDLEPSEKDPFAFGYKKETINSRLPGHSSIFSIESSGPISKGVIYVVGELSRDKTFASVRTFNGTIKHDKTYEYNSAEGEKTGALSKFLKFTENDWKVEISEKTEEIKEEGKEEEQRIGTLVDLSSSQTVSSEESSSGIKLATFGGIFIWTTILTLSIVAALRKRSKTAQQGRKDSRRHNSRNMHIVEPSVP